jgi:hypothetical protein
VLIPSPPSTSKTLHSKETPTIKQRDLSVSGHKKLCSSRNLAMLTEVVSAPLESSKANDSQYERDDAPAGDAIIEAYRAHLYEHV